MKEKATNPKRVKGTVLFTVVAVMMVMIVFLVGTLALATTASNRAYSKYQKVQTESIARAVLDAVSNTIADDTTGSGICTDIINGAKNGNSITIPVTMGDSGATYDVIISETPQRQTFLNSENHWASYKIYEMTVTVDKTLADTTYTAYTAVDVETTTTPGGGHWEFSGNSGFNNGGAYVSMGDSTSFAVGGYITGGTYIGIDPAKKTQDTYTLGNNPVIIDSPFYVNGNATTGVGLYVKFHFSAPGDFFAVTGNYTESQANQLKTDYTDFQWSSAYKTELDTSDNKVKVIKYQKNADGTLYRNASGNPVKIGYFTDVATETDGVPMRSYDYTKTPYMYIGGTLKLQSDSTAVFGCPEVPTNLYVGSLQGGNAVGSGNKIGPTVYGDMYLMDPSKETYLYDGDGSHQTKLYNWADSNLFTASKDVNVENYKGSKIYGNLFSKNKLTLDMNNGDYEIHGDIRVDNASGLTIKGNKKVTVDGDIIVNGPLVIESNAEVICKGNVYATTINNSGKLTVSGNLATVSGYTGNAAIAPGAVTGYQKTWYTDYTPGTPTLKGAYGWGSQFAVTYTYVKHEMVVDGSGAVITPESTSNETHGEVWFNTPAGITDPADAIGYFTSTDPDFSKNSEANANVITLSGATATKTATTGTSVKALNSNTDVYPSEFELANIKDTIGLVTPTTVDYVDLYKSETDRNVTKADGTVEFREAEVKSTWPSITLSSLPTDPADKTTTNFYYDSTMECYVIKSNCKIISQTINHNIYVDPSTDVSIVLDSCTFKDDSQNGTSLIADETSSRVEVYVKNTVSMGNGGGGLFTKYYWDTLINKPYGTSDVLNSSTASGTLDLNAVYTSVANSNVDGNGNRCPNLIIYSVGSNAVLDMNCSRPTFATALIQAPEMIFKAGLAPQIGTTINYTNTRGSTCQLGAGTGNNASVGVIGQLIAEDITLVANRTWDLVYVTIDDGTNSSSGFGTGGGTMRWVPDGSGVVTATQNNSKVLYFNNY